MISENHLAHGIFSLMCNFSSMIHVFRELTLISRPPPPPPVNQKVNPVIPPPPPPAPPLDINLPLACFEMNSVKLKNASGFTKYLISTAFLNC